MLTFPIRHEETQRPAASRSRPRRSWLQIVRSPMFIAVGQALAVLAVIFFFRNPDRLGDEIRTALAAREEAFKRARWNYVTRQMPPQDDVKMEGEIQLSDGAIAYTADSADSNHRFRYVFTPKHQYMEMWNPAGRIVGSGKESADRSRRWRLYDSAELQGLTVGYQTAPLSKFLERAPAKKISHDVVRFAVPGKRGANGNDGSEYDFEAAPPFRLKSIRQFNGSDGHERYFEPKELAEAAGQWYVVKGIAGVRNHRNKPHDWHARVLIVDFQPTSPPIDVAALEEAWEGKKDKAMKSLADMVPKFDPMRDGDDDEEPIKPKKQRDGRNPPKN